MVSMVPNPNIAMTVHKVNLCYYFKCFILGKFRFSFKRRTFLRLLFCCLSTFVFLKVTILSNGKYEPLYLSKNLTDDNQHLILLWTTWFGTTNWTHSTLSGTYCQFSNCQLITDRSKLEFARVVIFHIPDLNSYDLPTAKYIGQHWVLFTSEAPTALGRQWKVMKMIEDHIDWTMTYRLDSDIAVPYGEILKRDKVLPEYRVNYKSKTKEVVWVVSHCNTDSDREVLVQELSDHIEVDIYGHCGSHTCGPRGSDACFRKFERDYKFYISFENAICPDYVTEKVYHVMEFDLVPVVLGGANYKSMFPPNSFIDALNFTSAHHLADYLHLVANNEELYQSYFEWKKYYTAKRLSWESMCTLCEKLNDHNLVNNLRQRSPFTQWFSSGCTSLKTYTKLGYLKALYNFKIII